MLVTLNLLVQLISGQLNKSTQNNGDALLFIGKSQGYKLFGVFCCLEQKFIIKDQFLDLCVLKFF